MFWLDNSLLSVICYFGNHTSYTIIQDKVLASVGQSCVQVYKDFIFFNRTSKDYFCKATQIEIVVIKQLNDIVLKNISSAFVQYLVLIQQGSKTLVSCQYMLRSIQTQLAEVKPKIPIINFWARFFKSRFPFSGLPNVFIAKSQSIKLWKNFSIFAYLTTLPSAGQQDFL